MADAPIADQKRKRPWLLWLIGGLVCLVILSALFGDDSKDRTTARTQTVGPVSPPDTQTTAAESETLKDAENAVKNDDYAKAVAIAATLGTDEEDTIRGRIANRIARRASAAVRAGNRGRAKTLLARADDYPSTTLMRQARSTYRAAAMRASERARMKRAAAAESRRAAAELREQQAAETDLSESSGDCDPNYSGCVPAYPPDVNCPDVDGPVQVTGSDPHGLDRDGDGVGCDS